MTTPLNSAGYNIPWTDAPPPYPGEIRQQIGLVSWTWSLFWTIFNYKRSNRWVAEGKNGPRETVQKHLHNWNMWSDDLPLRISMARDRLVSQFRRMRGYNACRTIWLHFQMWRRWARKCTSLPWPNGFIWKCDEHLQRVRRQSSRNIRPRV